MDTRLSELKNLQEHVRNLEAGDENKRRLSYWQESAISNDYWHGIPKNEGDLNFVVELERATYAKVAKFSMVDFYQDPIEMALANLKIAIFKFENFMDMTPIGRSFACYLGAGFEKALFGGDQIYSNEDAWLAREVLIKDRVPVDSLKVPDFYQDGIMPHAHFMYNNLLEIMDDDFTVVFPQWSRSPFGVAWHIRGIDNLLMDMIDDETWFTGFLSYITRCRKEWSMCRAKHLNIPLQPCNIYNDEVTCPVISPNIYEKYILPTEIDLVEFFGGINYWHSCGDTTLVMHLINKIPGLHMTTSSAWSDPLTAARVYSKSITIEQQLHPYNDIVAKEDIGRYRDKIRFFKEVYKEHKAIIHAAGIQVNTVDHIELQRIKKWIDVANEELL